MDIGTYLEQASLSDRMPQGLEGVRIALLGLTGEAGSAASAAKKQYRDNEPPDHLVASLGEELGDVMWYVAAVARRLDLDLAEVLQDNLDKTRAMWTSQLSPPPTHDHAYPAQQRLPRQFAVDFEPTAGKDNAPAIRLVPVGEELKARVESHRRRKGLEPLRQIGDVIDDNAPADLSYRFHDVIHLAHAAVLGWSPVLRSMIGAKRKADPMVDRVQDGARAIATEEAIVAIVFNHAEDRSFQLSRHQLDWDLIRHLRRSARGLEVADEPPIAWWTAYVQAFDAFVTLRSAGRGRVICDLDARQLVVDTT